MSTFILLIQCFMKSVWFELPCLKAYFIMTIRNRLNHTGGDCFSPYRALFSLHTTHDYVSGVYSRRMSIYTSSLRFLCRKAFFTSHCFNGQSRFRANESNTLTILIFATGGNVLCSQYHRFEYNLWQPIAPCTSQWIHLLCAWLYTPTYTLLFSSQQWN